MESDVTVYRTCSKCSKAITEENKVIDKHTKSGVYSHCRACKSQSSRDLRKKISSGQHKPKIHTHTTTCIYCSEELTEETSYKNKYSSTGLHNTCKQCSCRLSSIWTKNNPGKRNIYKHNRRCKERSLPSTLTPEEWLTCLEYFNHRCAYCSKERKLQIEHVIPVANVYCPGTVAENVVPSCRSCNSSKNSHNVYLWLCKKYGVQRAVLVYNRINGYIASVKENRNLCSSGLD